MSVPAAGAAGPPPGERETSDSGPVFISIGLITVSMTLVILTLILTLSTSPTFPFTQSIGSSIHRLAW